MRPHNQNLGLIRYRLGQWDLAEENFRQALQISRDIGHPQGEAARAARARHAGAAAAASSTAPTSTSAARSSWRRRSARSARSLLAREFLAEIELDRGDAAEALALLEPALEEARSRRPQGDLVVELETRLGIALLAARSRRRRARAPGCAGRAVRAAGRPDRAGDRRARAGAARGDARQRAGLEIKIRAAAQCFEELGEIYELARTLARWGELLLLLPASDADARAARAGGRRRPPRRRPVPPARRAAARGRRRC